MKKLAPILIVAVLAIAGCGSDDGGSSGGSLGGDDEAQIRQVLDRASEYMADKEYGNYCDLLSPDAIAEIEDSEGFQDATCESLMLLAGGMISDSDIEQIADPDSIEIDGDQATITYPSDSEVEGFTMQKVDGKWMLGPDPDEDSGDTSSDSGL